MKKIVLPLLLLGFMCGCQQEKPIDKPEKLQAVLTHYFDGIKARDFQKMKDVTTTDFVLYEDGKVFNNDSLINMLTSFGEFKGEFKFDILKTNVDNATGNMYYYNTGQFTFNDTTQVTYNWIESAAFRKVDDEWKLEFLHSTVRK